MFFFKYQFLTRICVFPRHILNCLVQNEPGVLSRISGILAGRGFNIDSLVVCRTEIRDLSRMCIVLSGQDAVVEQARRQLEDLVHLFFYYLILSRCPERFQQGSRLGCLGLYRHKNHFSRTSPRQSLHTRSRISGRSTRRRTHTSTTMGRGYYYYSYYRHKTPARNRPCQKFRKECPRRQHARYAHHSLASSAPETSTSPIHIRPGQSICRKDRRCQRTQRHCRTHCENDESGSVP